MNMQIVIPMSGQGARFKDAGYVDLKPLIRVHGRPIIEHVVSLFPGEDDFVFICDEQHLRDTGMEKILLALKPNAKIVAISRKKLGPVYAVSQAFDFIKDDEPVIVNYCDFFMDWNYIDFKKIVFGNDWDAALPVYTGFHPHLLHEKNLYASVRTGGDGYLQEIREKYSFTTDKTLSAHSPGTHFFRKGSSVKKYFKQLMEEKIDLNGEYYASLVYNLLVRDGLKVGIYDKIDHFCQWGTPFDLEEYNYWIGNLKGSVGGEGKISYSDDVRSRILGYWQTYLDKYNF